MDSRSWDLKNDSEPHTEPGDEMGIVAKKCFYTWRVSDSEGVKNM